MKKLTLLLTLIIFALAGCEYPDAGALENNQWIGNINNPYQGIVSDNFYTWNGTNYVRIPAAGLLGAAGATGATGAQGPAGDAGFGQGCRVWQSASNTTLTGVAYFLTFDTEKYDTDNCHNSTNLTRLTCNTAGKYIIIANVQYSAAAGNIRQLFIVKNGTINVGGIYEANATNNGIVSWSVSTVDDMVAGDYVETYWYQTSGSSLTIYSGSYYTPAFMMQRIGT